MSFRDDEPVFRPRIRPFFQLPSVEGYTRTALSLSDLAYVLERGEVALEGRCDEIKRNEKVARAYLGQLE